MGVKVYLDSAKAPAGAVTNATFPGQTQSGLLPLACRHVPDDCWREGVRNGTIKFVESGTKNPNQLNRAIVIGYFKTVDTVFGGLGGLGGLYCKAIMYADDGSKASFPGGGSFAIEEFCNTWEEVFHMGNALGAIFDAINPSTGANVGCYQMQHDQSSGGWVNVPMPCP